MMGLHQDPTDQGLQLILGLALTTSTPDHTVTPSPPSISNTLHHLTTTHRPNPYSSKSTFISTNNSQAEPSLTLALSRQTYPDQLLKLSSEDPLEQTSPHSAISSFSGGSGRVKRERDLSCEEADATETERVSSRASDEEEDGTTARKKLRLTKEQSALLEESFKQHSTLNPVIIISLLILFSSMHQYISWLSISSLILSSSIGVTETETSFGQAVRSSASTSRSVVPEPESQVNIFDSLKPYICYASSYYWNGSYVISMFELVN